MIIEVNVKRADQSWDIDTGQHHNFLVLDVLGVEVKAPCSEEQLVSVISQLRGGAAEEPEPEDEDEEQEEAQESWPDEEEVRRAPPVFVQQEPREEPNVPVIMRAPSQQPATRHLQPIGRKRKGDDAGIAQG